MKTTLSLEEDVAKALRRLAKSQGLTMGEVATSLLRHALTVPKAKRAPRRVHPPFPVPTARA